MPEVGIGFFPDVGGTYFLPRLPHRAGVYLALTGLRADAGDALAFGLAQTFVPSAAFGGSCPGARGAPTTSTRRSPISPRPPPASALMAEADGLEALLLAPRSRGDPGRSGGGGGQRLRLRRSRPAPRCSASRRPARRWRCARWRWGRRSTSTRRCRIEYRIVSRVCRGHDFYEGVRALIVDKDNRPVWSAPPSDGGGRRLFRSARAPTN